MYISQLIFKRDCHNCVNNNYLYMSCITIIPIITIIKTERHTIINNYYYMQYQYTYTYTGYPAAVALCARGLMKYCMHRFTLELLVYIQTRTLSSTKASARCMALAMQLGLGTRLMHYVMLAQQYCPRFNNSQQLMTTLVCCIEHHMHTVRGAGHCMCNSVDY